MLYLTTSCDLPCVRGPPQKHDESTLYLAGTPTILPTHHPVHVLIMNRPFLWNPALWGSLLLTAAALLASTNPGSPLWLRTLLWIGLTLYNALWWLLQIPEHTLQKDAAPPEAQQELERLKRSIFTSRLFNALLLAAMSCIMLLVFWTGPGGAGSQSLGIYAGVLFIALLLGVISEWRRYRASRPGP